MADKILRRTSYGGEQTENISKIVLTSADVCIFMIYITYVAPIIQINRQTSGRTASSEPKLFMKTAVFSRQKAMRHTFRFHHQQPDSGKKCYLRFIILKQIKDFQHSTCTGIFINHIDKKPLPLLGHFY